jgi:hypothetical protein
MGVPPHPLSPYLTNGGTLTVRQDHNDERHAQVVLCWMIF